MSAKSVNSSSSLKTTKPAACCSSNKAVIENTFETAIQIGGYVGDKALQAGGAALQVGENTLEMGLEKIKNVTAKTRETLYRM